MPLMMMVSDADDDDADDADNNGDHHTPSRRFLFLLVRLQFSESDAVL